MCNSDRTAEIMMKQRISKDSVLITGLTTEIDEINKTLDSVASLDAELNSSDINKVSALEKISHITDLLEMRSKRIDSLNRQLGKISYIHSAQLQKQKAYYQSLYKKVDSLSSQNSGLRSLLSQRERELANHNEVMNNMRSELEKQTNSLNKMESDIIHKELKNKEDQAAMYFTRGKEYLASIEITKGKNEKKAMYRKSLDAFARAQELGHPEAQKMIEKVQKDKKYSKYAK